MRQSTPRLGIALSGGTLKAATHVGVLIALEKAGIVPDCIAGTSAGSLVGALYAHGYNHVDLQNLVTSFPGFRLIDYGFPIATSLMSLAVRKLLPRFVSTVPVVPNGLLRGRKFEQYIQCLLQDRKPDIPFFIVATDLVSGGPVVFHTQADFTSRHVSHPITDLPKIITGSCALPGIFTPVPLGKYQLVDGAFRHYVPVTVLREFGCKKIIAVNLYRLPQSFEPATIIDVLARSFDILLRESIDNDLEHNQDLFVIEPDLTKIKWHSFSDMKRCYRIGQSIIEREQTAINSFLL